MAKTHRIALFLIEPRSLTSLAISVGTLCTITHCAIEVDGVWKDASETRGDYDALKASDYENRQCLIIHNVPAAEGKSIDLQLKNMKYDWQGVRSWLPRRILAAIARKKWIPPQVASAINEFTESNTEPYCFEVGYLALTGQWNSQPVSGCDIRSLASLRGLPIQYGQFGVIA